MRQVLPALPVVPDALLADYAAAHRALGAAISAAPEAARRVWHALSIEHHLDCLARIDPVFTGLSTPPLLPGSRAFLSPGQRDRRAGVAAAWRYVDSRLAMQRRGLQPSAIVPETAYVLHALAEGRTDNVLESNPGMPRATENWWVAKHTTFRTAEPEDTRRIIDAATDVAMTSDAPGVVIGGWLGAVVSSAHPFVDGNGRLLRLWHLLAAGRDLPLTVDWGYAEQIMFFRDRYVAALKQSHMADGVGYDGASIDPAPYTRAVISWSIDGAHLALQRLRLVTDLLSLAVSWGVEQSDAGYVAALAWRGFAGVSEMAPMQGADYSAALACLERLSAGGACQRLAWPPARRAQASGAAYRLSEPAHVEVHALVQTHLAAATPPPA